MPDETEETGFFKEGDIIALLTPAGTKPSKAVIRVDKLMPLLTRAELEELRQRLDMEILFDPETEPEVRREILSRFDVCPCCQRWLGHNNPPGDDSDPPPPAVRARQKSFASGRGSSRSKP
jgi:hypothetical protein